MVAMLFSMHRHSWRRRWYTWIRRSLIGEFIIKEPWQSIRCLGLHRDPLLQLPRFLVHKTKQDMLAAHTLADMANAWVF